MYKIVNLEQGSQEWLDWRTTRITASEIACIVGTHDAFTTAATAWLKKKGKLGETKDNKAMQRGRFYEPHLRQYLSLAFEKPLEPVCVENTTETWVGASLDGLEMLPGDFNPNITRDFWELKIPGKATHNKVRDGGLEAFVLYVEKYYSQVQWQYAALGNSAKGHYSSAIGLPFEEEWEFDTFIEGIGDGIVDVLTLDVPLDLEYQAKLLEFGKRFYDSLSHNVLPEKELRQIVLDWRSTTKPPASKEVMEELAYEYGELLEEKSALLTKLKAKKKALLSFADSSNKNIIKVGPLTIKRSEGKKTLNADLLEHAGVNPEEFSVIGNPGWKITKD